MIPEGYPKSYYAATAEGVHKKRYVGYAREYAAALAERYDYPYVKALSREETRQLVATDDFLEGLLDTKAMSLHPLNYALGIARAARAAGVRLFENSRVTGYSRNDPVTVSTATGHVDASFIVLACNGYLGKLEPRVAGKIIAEAIGGTAGRFDVMASLPTYTFPGGTMLRYPGMVLGMLYYSLKDRL